MPADAVNATPLHRQMLKIAEPRAPLSPQLPPRRLCVVKLKAL